MSTGNNKHLLIMVFFLFCGCEKSAKKERRSLPVEKPTTIMPEAGPAKTKEQCNDAGNSWIAVVNGGESPATCGSKLSSWGCCQAEVTGRFPALSNDLGERISSRLSAGYLLYNCSSEGEKTHKLHFARFPGSGKTDYAEISIDGFAYDSAIEGDDCPQIPNVEFPTASEGSQSDGADVVNFDLINEQILKVNCAASGCHNESDLGQNAMIYVDNQENVLTDKDKIKILAELQTVATYGTIEHSPMSSAKQEKMLQYLNQ
jgi:hypothetical protein